MLLSGAALLVALAAALYWGARQMQASEAGEERPASPAGVTEKARVEPVSAAPAISTQEDSAARTATLEASAAPTVALGPVAIGPVAAASALPALAGESPTPAATPAAGDGAPAGPTAAAEAAVENTVVALAQQATAVGAARLATAGEPIGAEAKANEHDMLAERLQATLDWLEREAPETHSVQLLGSENPQQLKDHLSSIAKSIEISNLYVYRTVARQKPFLTVLYGSFGSREAAQKALDRLPPPLKAFKPYLRTVQGIREEMSRNKTL
jgi:MSHA biogenesis protein MshM